MLDNTDVYQDQIAQVAASMPQAGISRLYESARLSASTGSIAPLEGALAASFSNSAQEITAISNGIRKAAYEAVKAGVKPATAVVTVLNPRVQEIAGAQAFAALKLGIEEGFAEVMKADRPAVNNLKAFLQIADFMRQQAPMIEGQLGHVLARPTQEQLGKVSFVLFAHQSMKSDDRTLINKLLEKVNGFAAPGQLGPSTPTLEQTLV